MNDQIGYSDAYLESCTVQNERAIEELRQCRMTNTWPTRTEDIKVRVCFLCEYFAKSTQEIDDSNAYDGRKSNFAH